MKKLLWFLPLVLLVPLFAYAQAADPVPVTDWLGQLLTTVKDFLSSSMTWQVKLAALIALIVSSMNVTLLKSWVWDKLGNFKIWLAPALGLVAGVLNALNGGSWGDVWQYVAAGGGAVFVHEILDLVKLIPGIGSMWINLINMIENIPVIGAQSGKSPTKTS
jgi:hypothetical protein